MPITGERKRSPVTVLGHVCHSSFTSLDEYTERDSDYPWLVDARKIPFYQVDRSEEDTVCKKDTELGDCWIEARAV